MSGHSARPPWQSQQPHPSLKKSQRYPSQQTRVVSSPLVWFSPQGHELGGKTGEASGAKGGGIEGAAIAAVGSGGGVALVHAAVCLQPTYSTTFLHYLGALSPHTRALKRALSHTKY